ncbi:MAG: DUF1080 domain-containing protein [Pirellulales bacterium]
MRYWKKVAALFCAASATSFSSFAIAQETAKGKAPAEVLQGRWDLTVHGKNGDYPSWIEVTKSGSKTLVGRYVGQFGSARPIAHVQITDSTFHFVVPPQWEGRKTDVVVEGKIDGDRLSGTVTGDDGKELNWEAVRAPKLEREAGKPVGNSIEVFNGTDLKGWKPQFADRKNGWVVRDGLLSNVAPGNNLMTEEKFDDFELNVEFRYPQGSNGGIYLRGRYEVQIEDNFGLEADSHRIGGVYGYLTPSFNAARKAGEWQEATIRLVGRRVTVMLNGKRVIDEQIIPGVTGGALDSREAEPGPLLLQGDHGPVEFRKVQLQKLSR